jgi:hypothetical protein
MAKTKLRQLLDHVEDNPGISSLGSIARELDLSRSQVEQMLEFWVRKGRLQRRAPAPDCASCDSSGSCPYLVDLQRSDQPPGDFFCLTEED